MVSIKIQCWSFFLSWWKTISSILVKHSSVLKECTMFSFPTNKDEIFALNYCILHTKYYIHIQRLFNQNNTDIHRCLAQIKHRLEREHKICYVKKKIEKINLININLYMTTCNSTYHQAQLKICRVLVCSIWMYMC